MLGLQGLQFGIYQYKVFFKETSSCMYFKWQKVFSEPKNGQAIKLQNFSALNGSHLLDC